MSGFWRGFLGLCLCCVASVGYAVSCAEGSAPFEHSAGTTCIPKNPKRIVTLHSLSLSIAVYELGAGDRLVGDVGVVPDGREPMVHPITRYHTGLRYEEGVFDYIPWPLDFEKIASLKPDLILGRDWETEFYDQLSLIAPTVILDMSPSIEDISAQVARAINAEGARQDMHVRFLERVNEIDASLGQARGREVAFLTVLYFDDLRVADRFHAMSEAMDQVGLKPAQSVRQFVESVHGPGTTRHRASLSPERIDLVDVDFLLLPYWASETDLALEPGDVDHGAIAADVYARLDEKVPGFCTFLRVCQTGRMIVFEATPTYTPTYSGLMSALDFIESEIVGRDQKPFASE